MDERARTRARRESLSLNHEDVVSHAKHQTATVLSPAITRRPALDAMLGDMAMVSRMCLERIRNKVMDGLFLDRDEMKEFKELCETVLRQARVEMEVEDHVAKRMTSMSTDQIYQTIQQALHDAGVDTRTSALVLNALGMTTPTNEFPSQT